MSPVASPSVRLNRSPRLDPDQQCLKWLRAAASYAELALLTGTWATKGIERIADGKSSLNRKGGKAGTRKYRRYLQGSGPSTKTIKAIEKKYPMSRLADWNEHPIGVLITNPRLSPGQIVDQLMKLPDGDERGLIWIDSGSRQPQSVPDGEDIIGTLVQQGTSSAFLALLGRHRLRLLESHNDYLEQYEFALIDCFPKALCNAPHLFLAKHLMIDAFLRYLHTHAGWPVRKDLAKNFVNHFTGLINSEERKAMKSGVFLPPARYVDLFRDP